MSQSENLFDTAISQADDAILRVMGTVATITSGVLAGATLTGVFDDPESVSYAAGGVRIEGDKPTFFVKTSLTVHLKRPDTLTILGDTFWVDRITPAGGDSSIILLGRGEPPTDSRSRITAFVRAVYPCTGIGQHNSPGEDTSVRFSRCCQDKCRTYRRQITALLDHPAAYGFLLRVGLLVAAVKINGIEKPGIHYPADDRRSNQAMQILHHSGHHTVKIGYLQ